MTEMQVELSLTFYNPCVLIMHKNHILRVTHIVALMVVYVRCLFSFICV